MFEKYKLVLGKNLTWDVVETLTTHVIGNFVFPEDAEACLKRQLSGVGFDGWTPFYVLRKPKYKYETEDINA